MSVVVVHVDRDVASPFFEELLGQRSPYQIERLHPDPVGPRVAHDDDIAVIWRNLRIVLDQIIARLRRLQPVVAIPRIWNTQLLQSLGQSDHILLEVSRFVPAVEVDSHRTILMANGRWRMAKG